MLKKCLSLLPFILMAIASDSQKNYVVTAVHDGDTYTLLVEGKLQIVRLESIDAPELKQAYGVAVRDSVRAMIERKIVTVYLHGNDLYGRQLASIAINGQSLDSLLISKGFAWHYAKYSNKQDLSICEAAAKAKCIGLWLCPDPVPPWVWRKLNARNKRLYGVCR